MDIISTLQATQELFLPRHCMVCGCTGASSGLCSLCYRIVSLRLTRPRRVPNLLVTFPVISAGEYDGLIARCILGYKEHLRTDAIDILAAALARSIDSFLANSRYPLLVLVPVPSSFKSLGRRGFYPSVEICRVALKFLNRSGCQTELIISDALVRRIRVIPSQSQKKLGRLDRQKKIKGSMNLARNTDFSNLPCLLIDDVVTTGASFKEAYRVLDNAGAQVLGAATVAWVRRKSTLSDSSEAVNKCDTGHNLL